MRYLKPKLLQSLSLLLCLVAANASAAETDSNGRRYAASPNPAADVQQALQRAADNDRHALVVLGANWCHDSRALASRLHKSPLSDLVEQEYELVFVDVGFYDNRTDVLSRFDVDQYYATPTVLIIDPDSEKVINNTDRHIWGDAYRISMSESVDYFERWANSDGTADASPASNQLRDLYAQIDRFEAEMAERVAAGYAVVGPMLEARVAGNSPSDFNARWDELSAFRNAVPGDVQALKAEAERRVAEGDESVELEFPEYPELSWEAD